MIDPKALAGRFPKDFIFGTATASYQIEGAAREDGRKPSIWDAFSHMPGRVYNRDTGDIACDHYHRVEEDLDLMASLGVETYRFSIAWPRIIPDGRGPVNEAGLDFYDRLIDACKARGIKTNATLYHWDLPLTLAGDGGWTVRSTAYAFQRYVQTVMKRFGDRLDFVSTFNEPWCVVYLSHLYGIHAPGEKSIEASVAALHTVNLAHGLAVEAIRQEAPDVAVGIVCNHQAIIPVTDSEEDKAACERAFQFNNGVFFDPIFKGEYPADFMAAYGDIMPKIEDGDLALISQPLDWWGLNYYKPERYKHNPEAPFPSVADGPALNDVFTDIGWEVDASALKFLVHQLYDRYELPDMYITENGACYNMAPVDGVVDDQPRIEYLSEHLGVVADLIEAGRPIKGYYAWSLMDNFEWAEGYKMRFGLIYINYETQERTVKNSGKWFKALAEEFLNAEK
ncbi:GH1 family beta-glucosidase [Martelella mediterranea]|uniref:Beta-glucosidase n=1 Tax=Martelella mediterranea TaxID=293089 RepID=A0A4R3NVR8_9HYPH|nr:GH1 family beta-glucosidase [Martelella mediterranea]TCT41803.1 beta-glucosidase [Martelella mediterranea]